jgi:hypothetical protein
MKIYWIVTWCIITLTGHWSEPQKDAYGRTIHHVGYPGDLTWSSENRTILYDTLYDCNHEKQFYNRADAMKFIYEGAAQDNLTNFTLDSIK